LALYSLSALANSHACGNTLASSLDEIDTLAALAAFLTENRGTCYSFRGFGVTLAIITYAEACLPMRFLLKGQAISFTCVR
jgi:hypothetical protein